MENNQGIVLHPYLSRQRKKILKITSATVKSTRILMLILDIAENMCTCSDEEYTKLLPVFKELYSLIGDADKEIDFIRNQRTVNLH